MFFLSVPPRVSSITCDGCLVEWSPVKMQQQPGEIHYKVQINKNRDAEAKMVRRNTVMILYDTA